MTITWKARGLTAMAATVALGVLPSCVATRHFDGAPAGAGHNRLLDGTAVGDNRCDSGQATTSPFVVEWDATDLSTFEAKASRDVVLVKYEGCRIEMLYGCSDNGIPGRYGRYQEPIFTSGTVESFEMKNQDEVWAKLPLGAAKFGGSVEIGETLELRYYVSGVVNSTRNYIERGALAQNPRCAGATHFVSAYNLGAFELLAHKGASGSVDVGVKGGAGVGGSTSSASSNLKHGGSIESCDTQAQRQCRVPIRLVLQPIDEASGATGDQPANSAAWPAPPIDAPPQYEDTPAARAYKLRRSAEQKEQAGDGHGCLEDLERARALEDTEQSRRSSSYIGALCMMRAGRCEEGQALMREYLGDVDSQRRSTDAQIEMTVSSMAASKCPVSQQKDARGKATALMVRVQEAQARSDSSGCVAAAQEARGLLDGVDRKNVQERNTVAGVIMMAASCLAALERCEDAKKLWFDYYDAAFTGTMPDAEVRAAAEQTFAVQPACKGK